MRYFESKTPLSKVYCSGGRVVSWSTYDGLTGWHASNYPEVHKALDRCIAKQVGGLIREISQEEYEEAIKKVNGRPRWAPVREHLSSDGLVTHQAVAPQPLPAAGEDVAETKPVTPDTSQTTDESPNLRRRGGRRSEGK